MKIIDIAICIDNRDPENLGRIRCVRYSSYTGQVERAMDYKEWDDKDLFTALPFLPNNINFIPEIGQTVKIINYNTDKESANTEYIAGPFTTRHDYNSQTHSVQLERTTYGNSAKQGKKIIDENGNFIDEKSKGVLAKHTDYGVYGKYGSDVLFTENGLQLRGGKLTTKDSAKGVNKKDMLYKPMLSKKSAILYLKKFPKAKEYKEEVVETKKLASADIRYFIEYSIDNFNNFGEGQTGATISYYVYQINKSYGNIYKTYNPTLLDAKLIDGHYKLINTDGTTTTPTFTKTVPTLIETYVTIRNDIKTLHYKGLNEFNITYPNDDLHPFYFRPTKECRENLDLTTQEFTNRSTIFKNISINEKSGPEHGLAFQKTSISPPQITIKRNELVLKDLSGSAEQTFSALKSDKIYLLTTDAYNVSQKPINFEKLDKYELTQDNYLQDIEPNTYATVRGETLLEFLRSMHDVLTTHIHNINDPYAKLAYDAHDNMERLYQKLEEDILNKSIRIN
jgi:hypothetical protein